MNWPLYSTAIHKRMTEHRAGHADSSNAPTGRSKQKLTTEIR
jgi:hypothetical protein